VERWGKGREHVLKKENELTMVQWNNWKKITVLLKQKDPTYPYQGVNDSEKKR